MEEVTLCGANAYEQKYYLNPLFDKMPESVKDELKIICVIFTEEVGGVFTIGFDEEGELKFTTESAEDDYLYDDIAAGLLVSKVRATRHELLSSLSLFYRAFVLKEDLTKLLDEEGE